MLPFDSSFKPNTKRQRSDSGHGPSIATKLSTPIWPPPTTTTTSAFPQPTAFPVTHSVSFTAESTNDSMSLQSAYSGTSSSRSSLAGSSMSVRVQRFHFGTPGPYHRSSSTPSLAADIPFSNTSHISQTSGRPSSWTRLRTRAQSIASGHSSRQTRQSWRRRRVSLLMDQHLPDFETQVFCPTCEKWIQSRIRYRLGSMAWLVAFILLMCTVFLFWIPFYVKYFKDVVHYCPACGTKIGRHSRI
ncbi:LITAF-like zinc ribbon domain-containing protein [Phycomyces nitens]|nr:LITAF-like zinc ribbon domain-containing protein [Phycomyces nitens]